MTQFEGRTSDHPIDPIFLERWSPRAFTGEAMDQPTLLTILEAARWAPSSYNSQPWRIVYAHRDTAAWAPLLDLLVAANRAWAERAAVLFVLGSSSTMQPPGAPAPVPSWSHSFDAGAAWANLALQASRLGWHAHAMVGFDRDRAFSELGFPEGTRIEAAVALGRRGDRTLLPEPIRSREAPNGRNAVESFALEGRWK